MRVLEPPIIWILVAVVLVALAAALIVFMSLRRARARRRAAAWGPAAALEPARPTSDRPRHSAEPDPETVPLDLAAARVPSVPPPPPDTSAERADSGDAEQHADHPTAAEARADDSTDDSADRPEPARTPVPPTSLAPSFSGDPSLDDEPLAAPLFRPWTMQARPDTRGSSQPRHALEDQSPAAESAQEPAQDPPVEPAAESAVEPSDGPAVPEPASEPVSAPADTDPEIPLAGLGTSAEEGVAEEVAEGEASGTADDPTPHDTLEQSAKDRLLAVLLRDPQAALRALDGEHEAEASATALLRAGLTPAQVARLVGVGEDELASVVARGLGLLRRRQGTEDRGPAEEPDRSWASAATPTTG